MVEFIVIIIMLAIGFYSVSNGIRLFREEREERKRKIYEERKRQEEAVRPITAEELYQKCKAERILDCVSAADQARIALIGRQSNLTGTDDEIIEKYKAGKKAVEGREKRNRIAEATKKELEILNGNRKYLNYTGRDKRIKMCYDKALEYRIMEQAYMAKMHKASESSYDAYRAMAQKELNWGIAGGIAEGLAGPAAGVMAALDAQRTNEEIRANNQKLASMLSEISVYSMMRCSDGAARSKDWAEEWEANLARAQTLLVQEYPKEEQKKLLDYLQPLVVDTKYSETGSIILQVKVQRCNNGCLRIYDDVIASVDGFFTAQLWQEDKNVGEALFGMEWDGSEIGRTMTGICMTPRMETQNPNITITFEPYNLWAIEYRNG